jgi:DNA-binding SARP family transcriptional activator
VSLAPRDPEPELDLVVLGRIGLSRGDRPIEPILAQPKRLALLAYLALRRPQDLVRRDELLGVFWPEATESRARASLRQALRFLRSHLGDEAIVTRGDGEVGVALGPLACDAVAFCVGLASGDDARAVARYGGELLPGLFLSGAHEFERWLHAERQSLRTAAVGAALRLADAAETRGELEAAAEHVRWAAALEPVDEAVARRLISLLARAGNRGAAVAAYEALAEQLREELELEPSRETADLVAAVRASDPAAASGAAALLPADGSSSLSPQRVLVLALEDLTGNSRLARIGGLAADVIAQQLAAIPELEVVPPLATMGAPGSEALSGDATRATEMGVTAERIELARRTGAGTLVEGSYHVQGSLLYLRARITNTRDRRLMAAPDAAMGPVSSPLDAIAALRDAVATTLAPALTRRAVHLRGAAKPPSLEAYRAYVDGMEDFIRGNWPNALDQFRAAAELAPAYALPRIVSAIAHWNLEQLPQARAIADEATTLRSSLGRFERAVLDMVLAWLDGDWAKAHAAARIQAELAPGSIPHFQVAEEARRLGRPRETREVLSRLDPEAGELRGWIFTWIELAAAHHLLGDHRRELEVANRCRGLHPDDPAAALLEVRAHAALGHVADVARVLDEILAVPGGRAPAPGELLREAALELRAHGAADAAEPLLERAVAWYEERASSERGGCHAPRWRRDLAVTLYHAGRLDEARTLFEELAEAGGDIVQPVGHHHGQLKAHLDAGYLAVIAARAGDTAEASRWCGRLEKLDGPFLYGAPWLWLAAVAAVRDQRDRAVSMLRQAFAGGLPHDLFVHTDPHLLRLRGHAPLDALLCPRK